MTEDEAKTKICHRSIDGDDSPAPVIANEMFAKRFACVASSCMAWRWEPQLYEVRESGQTYTTINATNAYGTAGQKLPRHGFCGLAGRP
jgi:hypothetical protein